MMISNEVKILINKTRNIELGSTWCSIEDITMINGVYVTSSQLVEVEEIMISKRNAYIIIRDFNGYRHTLSAERFFRKFKIGEMKHESI